MEKKVEIRRRVLFAKKAMFWMGQHVSFSKEKTLLVKPTEQNSAPRYSGSRKYTGGGRDPSTNKRI